MMWNLLNKLWSISGYIWNFSVFLESFCGGLAQELFFFLINSWVLYESKLEIFFTLGRVLAYKDWFVRIIQKSLWTHWFLVESILDVFARIVLSSHLFWFFSFSWEVYLMARNLHKLCQPIHPTSCLRLSWYWDISADILAVTLTFELVWCWFELYLAIDKMYQLIYPISHLRLGWYRDVSADILSITWIFESGQCLHSLNFCLEFYNTRKK